MKNVKNLLFDYGNVIIDIDIPTAFENIQNLYPETPKEEAWKKEFFELMKKYEVGQISTELFINGVLKNAKKKKQALDVIEAWNSMLVGIPQYRLIMLEALREKYNVVLLSNTNAMHIEWANKHLLEIHGVDNFEKRYFDDVYYSHVVGMRKPNPDIFKHVCSHSYLTPENTLFIDDMEENILAAKVLGFQVHLSPPEKEIAEYLKVEGYY